VNSHLQACDDSPYSISDEEDLWKFQLTEGRVYFVHNCVLPQLNGRRKKKSIYRVFQKEKSVAIGKMS